MIMNYIVNISYSEVSVPVLSFVIPLYGEWLREIQEPIQMGETISLFGLEF